MASAAERSGVCCLRLIQVDARERELERERAAERARPMITGEIEPIGLCTAERIREGSLLCVLAEAARTLWMRDRACFT